MSNFALICALAAGCVASDGTTQPTGTVMAAPIVWDGVTPYAPPGVSVVPYTGQVPYAPPAPPPTTIASLAFIQRFTPQEQATLTAANPLWGILIAAAGTIDVTNAQLLAQIQAAVAAGALTQARAAQVLDLAVASP